MKRSAGFQGVGVEKRCGSRKSDLNFEKILLCWYGLANQPQEVLFEKKKAKQGIAQSFCWKQDFRLQPIFGLNWLPTICWIG